MALVGPCPSPQPTSASIATTTVQAEPTPFVDFSALESVKVDSPRKGYGGGVTVVVNDGADHVMVKATDLFPEIRVGVNDVEIEVFCDSKHPIHLPNATVYNELGKSECPTLFSEEGVAVQVLNSGDVRIGVVAHNATIEILGGGGWNVDRIALSNNPQWAEVWRATIRLIPDGSGRQPYLAVGEADIHPH